MSKPPGNAGNRVYRHGLDARNALWRCHTLIREKRYQQNELIDEIGLDWNPAKRSRVFSNVEASYGNVSIDELKLINDFLFANNLNSQSAFLMDSLNSFGDYLYFALIKYFGGNLETETETKGYLEGLFRLYRPSLKIPGKFTIGLFQVTRDKDTDALCTNEIHRFSGDELEKPIKEEFHGYIFRKRRRYISLQRNLGKSNFLFTVFNDEFVDSEHSDRIFSLGGVAFGSVGSKLYFSRVYIERCEDSIDRSALIDTINYVGKEKVPPSVYRYLGGNQEEFFYVF